MQQLHKRLIASVLLLFLAVNISGCSVLSLDKVKEISVFSKPVQRAPLNLENPPAITVLPVEWTAVAGDGSNGLICLSARGYENLSLNILELRNYSAQSRAIIEQYKNYYEPGDKDDIRKQRKE
jgi:hypothetical protein